MATVFDELIWNLSWLAWDCRYLQNVYLWNFDIDDLRSGQYRDLSIISQRGNMQMLPVSNRAIWISLILSELWYISPSVMIQVHLLASDPYKGHLRSSEVTDTFLSITFDRKWRYSCAHDLIVFVSSRRIDWYATWPMLTYLGHHVTLTWGQIFKLFIQGQHVYVSMRLDERITMVKVKIIFFPFLVQKLFTKNHFRQKRPFWPFLTSGALSIDLSSILTTIVSERAVQELVECFFSVSS